MRKIKYIRTTQRKESVFNSFNIQRHNRVLIEENPIYTVNIPFLRGVLHGSTIINLKATELKNGQIILADKKSYDKYLTILDFYKNKISFNGFFLKDLSGIEKSSFEDRDMIINCLSLPFSDEDKKIFLEI